MLNSIFMNAAENICFEKKLKPLTKIMPVVTNF